jgi:diadenosine tetraphosphate (Ap4A) HIT family hydrolase
MRLPAPWAALFSDSSAPRLTYEIHGNTIPHLHMHLLPRTAGDVYIGYVIHRRVEFEQSTKDLEDLKTGIVARLREAKRLT